MASDVGSETPLKGDDSDRPNILQKGLEISMHHLYKINEFKTPQEAHVNCCTEGINKLCCKVYFCSLCCCDKDIYPRYNEIDCCYCKHEYQNGLIIPNRLQISGTLLKLKSETPTKYSYNNYIPLSFLILKIILLWIYIICVIIGMWTFCKIDGKYGPSCKNLLYWPMFLTQQMLILGLVYMILQTYITVKYYKYSNEVLLANQQDTKTIKYFIVTKGILQLVLSAKFVIVLQYWLLVNNSFEFNDIYHFLGTTATHGISFLCVLIVFLISYNQIYYKSSFLVFIYGFCYIIWLIIHYYSGIGDLLGNKYLYSIIDFDNNQTLAIISCVVIAITTPILHCIWTFIKNIILIKCMDFETVYNDVATGPDSSNLSNEP